ncbi:collagenase [Kitasatospora sp. LaBMicrA B282]|uniref:collagenase n=1 Tax=Kitasatospora sp. LaBMicrA B282 TaxID=3420949 RepID=UPI003D0B626E
MRLRIPTPSLPTLLTGLVAGCTVAATLLPVPALAASGPNSPRPPAAGSPAVPKPLGPIVAAGSADRAATAAPLPPALLGQVELGQPAGTAVQTTPRQAAPGTAAARTVRTTQQGCTPADFGSRSGTALASFVESATTDCVNTLFDVTATDAAGVFKEQQMLSVAKAFQGLATNYTGDDSTGIWQLVLFLRAGYYVQSYNAGVVGPYDAALTGATKAGLDAFFGSRHRTDVSDDNGKVLYDVLTLTDSANLQGDYLNVYQQVLSGYNASYNAFPKLANAVNAVLSAPLWRANWNPDFVNAVAADPGLLKTLSSFAIDHRDLLTGPDAFLDYNAGNDLARIAGDDATIEAAAKPLVKAVLDASQPTGATGPLYVHTAYQADQYDAAQCSYYGTCDLTAKLKAAVLPHTLVCDNRTIEAEALDPAELAAVCTSLRGEDTFFHHLVHDNGPVPGQYDKNYTLAVFAGNADYVTYSWAIFGNSTDNGGETLMDPTDPTNQAASVTYQKAYADGFTADVWNLNHEYTHYLDGIYDMKGSFATSTSVPDIWWIEGVAEYESYAYRGTTDIEAMQEAAKHTYKLSTIFQNTYANSDTVRTYPWGYLAVRYMFEKHPADITAMLGHFRAGDFQGAYQVYNSIGTAYDADFDAWLNGCAAGACYATGPTALFDQSVNGATVSLTDRSVETGNGRLTSWHWSFGDGTASDQQNPTHSYATAGTYTVALTATDSTGKNASTPESVTVTVGAGTTLPACTDASPDAMGRNCSRSDRAEPAGHTDYLYVYLPAGTTTLKVTTSGGTGTVGLYYDPSTWASPHTFTASSTGPGTTQSLTVTDTTAGYRHLSLYAVTDFSGVTVSTQY